MSLKAKEHQHCPYPQELAVHPGFASQYNCEWNLIRNEQGQVGEEHFSHSNTNVQNTLGKIKLHAPAKPWLFNKFAGLINDYVCLLVSWDLQQEGNRLLCVKGKKLSFALVSNGRVLIFFFSCLVSSGVNRLGNSTWCLTTPLSPSCAWFEIRADLMIDKPKRPANMVDHCLLKTSLRPCQAPDHSLGLHEEMKICNRVSLFSKTICLYWCH